MNDSSAANRARYRKYLAPIAFCFGLLFCTTASAAEPLAVYPPSFTLHGPEAMQQIAVTETTDGTPAAALPSYQYEMTSSNPAVVDIEDGRVVPKGTGRAELLIKTKDGREARAEVEVVDFDRPYHWNFRNDVESVLAKRGCNAGACHGALAGKGGFRLSLGSYNPEADHMTISREAQGRRIEPGAPGRSLLVAKPTGALPHKGGLRLDTDARDYRILTEWIAQGATGPSHEDARLKDVRVLPASSRLQPGDKSQVLVQAEYDDGRVVDVTQWARFTATDESVSSVDEKGRVTVRGPGEAAISVWFGSRIALARMSVPYPFDVPETVYAEAPRRNFIDDLTLAQLQELNLRPAERCDDASFIRRATLDSIGRLPTAEEVRNFLDDSDPTKRDALIERLLARDEFVDYWAYKWSDLMLVNGTKLRPAGVKSFYNWIREAVRENRPWDEFARAILTAQGKTTENGATNFYAIHQSPEDMTENVSQAFLGLSIGCAKCHNHPLEKWTNDQYYAMANLFSRVRAKGWGGDSRNGDGLRTLYVAKSGDLIQPSRGKPQPPAPLDAEPLPINDPGDRREALADWLVSSENPYFARAITNRVWANFFGVGLVEEVDDLRLSNPASNEPLLNATSQHLIDADFNLKQLMRSIMRSETYQRSSLPSPENEPEDRYFSRYYPRRLMAEVLLDGIDQVLDTSSPFNKIAFPGVDTQETDFYPEGTRAIQLYDSAVESYFLKSFGRNTREITCECERSSEPSMVQVLHLSNGDTLNPKLGKSENAIGRQIEAGKSDGEIIEQLFLSTLSRYPATEEREKIAAVVAEYGDDDRRQGLEDAFWSVLSSTEFLFNH